MDIRTFRAATLQEALEQVRETLGPDAAVLHTRQVKRSRMGLFSSSLVEVEASIEMPVASRLTKPSTSALRPHGKLQSNEPKGTEASQSEATAANPSSTFASNETRTIGDTKIEVAGLQRSRTGSIDDTENSLNNSDSESAAELSSKNSAAVNVQKLPPAMYETLSEMLDAGVEPAEAKSLLQAATKLLEIEQLNDGLLLRGRICQLVSKNLRIAEPITVERGQQSVIALVGPTGVGKTTTLAKLATSFQLDSGCRVGLVTMDTFRPGAVDQLLQYAETLDAALEVVSSARQFLPALHRLEDCDVVFIDTAGRSPNDTEQIRVLQSLLESAEPTSVQLVVSATSSTRHVCAAIEQFSPLNPAGLVITKLDEAIDFGAWLPILQNDDLPVSYVTHGQHVPRDFSPANRRRLASLLLGHANQAVA